MDKLNSILKGRNILNQFISEATRRNWDRLNTTESFRLTKRANKRLSTKKIVPVEYFTNKNNQKVVLDILSFLDNSDYSIIDVLCTVAENLFDNKNILNKANVQSVLSEYDYNRVDEICNLIIPYNETDLLGIIYQSNMMEGTKNKIGSYYTPHQVTSSMVSTLSFDNGETFIDPCCGSGAFLLSVSCEHPEQLYGIDNDEIAVMIAKFNLLLRYPDSDFIPNIICGNFLLKNEYSNLLFDYIVTNPPWGAFVGEISNTENITSQETFSLFFVKSYQQIKQNGIVRFLFPESILNVKVHKDIRAFILENCCLNSITIYDNSFSGVVTGFVDIECLKKEKSSTVTIIKNGEVSEIKTDSFLDNENNVFCFLNSIDAAIVKQCKELGKYSLSESIWALGIVTGNNKEKLKSLPTDGLEPIYTGKEILPYSLKKPSKFILYDRKSFQQVAKEEYYRAPEKLVYKFISNKLVFAYDNKQRLFLNSANILIPAIPKMNIKTVMALLNSELFSFLYQKMFGEVKILKGNLLQLPFPELSKEQDLRISTLVDNIISGCNEDEEQLQKEVYSLFDLNEKQIKHIRSVLYGKIRK